MDMIVERPQSDDAPIKLLETSTPESPSSTPKRPPLVLKVNNPVEAVKKLNPPTRMLCGPGPGNAHPRVHAAMSLPLAGYLDRDFLNVISDVQTLLRYVWQTNNQFTIPISGSASAAWEACVANLTAVGDVHVAFVSGYFGQRHADMARRYGADVRVVTKQWGESFTLEEIRQNVEQHRPNLIWVCHAETSTGAKQKLEGIAEVCRRFDCLFLLDAVTSLAGEPLMLDDLGVDACYTGSQKCLSCPPGISALTFGPRALAKMEARTHLGTPAANWYLDLNLLRKYYFDDENGSRVYHHTVPVSLLYAMRESLTILAEEGLEDAWRRHQDTVQYFWSLCDEIGLEMMIPDKDHRIVSLQTVKVPKGIDAAEACKYCSEKFRLEIGQGLGDLKGKVFRVGLMGYNSRREVALSAVTALSRALQAQGWVPKCCICR